MRPMDENEWLAEARAQLGPVLMASDEYGRAKRSRSRA